MQFESNSSPSWSAQATFDLVYWLQLRIKSRHASVRLASRVLNKLVAKPLASIFGKHHTIRAKVYGRTLLMPAAHSLPSMLFHVPQFNRPLALAAQAIAMQPPADRPLVVIDVGANIGDTVAIIEQALPGRGHFLCIEPDPELAAICRANFAENTRLHTVQAFVGEAEGTAVYLMDDEHRANPSTRLETASLSGENAPQGHLAQLDTIALPFAEAQGHISLIKVDTEGYDFSILRSGADLLRSTQPNLFFEWYPDLLAGLNEEPLGVFAYLSDLGYHHFVFYTNEGHFYCEASHPDQLFLRSLSSVARNHRLLPYFDVFASTSESVHKALVELSEVPGIS